MSHDPRFEVRKSKIMLSIYFSSRSISLYPGVSTSTVSWPSIKNDLDGFTIRVRMDTVELSRCCEGVNELGVSL